MTEVDPNHPIEADAIGDMISAPAKAMNDERRAGMMMMLNAMCAVEFADIDASNIPFMAKKPAKVKYRKGAQDMFEVIYKHMEDSMDAEQIG